MNGHALDLPRRPSSAPANERPILAGDEIGDRWIVGAPLGAGGHATVYRAEHRDLGHPVAIKVLHLDRLGTALEEMVQRFRREARIAAHMRHRNVVRVYDSGELPDGSPYFVMELIEGEDLQARIDREGPLSVPAALDVALQALAGLDALARAGVIHRDVKPGNVMLRARRHGGFVVKLVDFGISSVETGEADRVTIDGTVLGTPEYMAPEQIRGMALDPRADVYALGVVVYEILAGRLPFAGRGPCATLAMALTQDPPRLRDERPDVPEALETIVMRALEKEREHRWPDARAMATALRRAARELDLPLGPEAWDRIELAPAVPARRVEAPVDARVPDPELAAPRKRPAARAQRSVPPPIPPAVPPSAIIHAPPDETGADPLASTAVAPIIGRIVLALVTLGLAAAFGLRLTEPDVAPPVAHEPAPLGEVQSWVVPSPFTIPEPEGGR